MTLATKQQQRRAAATAKYDGHICWQNFVSYKIFSNFMENSITSFNLIKSRKSERRQRRSCDRKQMRRQNAHGKRKFIKNFHKIFKSKSVF